MNDTETKGAKHQVFSQLDMVEIAPKELIRACISGDEAGWRRFFEMYGRLIYTIPARFGFNAPDCDEIFQEASLEIISGLSAIQQPERLQAWIVTITRRTCIRRFRQQTDKNTIGLDEWEPAELSSMDESILSQIQLEEERVLLYRAMVKLGPKCQQLLTELFLSDEELSYAEIAEKLDMPLGSIGPSRQRCIDALQKVLQQMQKLEEP